MTSEHYFQYETPNFMQLDFINKGYMNHATYMHPNPRFYKYYWWIFCRESPCEGRAFLTKAHRLSTKAAFDLIDALAYKKQPYVIYNTRLPRLGPDTPFDPNSKRWASDTEWAPAYDEDTDPIYRDCIK